ncbi:unnamed protein product, partial [marine sediment metagenome]
SELLKNKIESNQTVLTEFESKNLLKEIGIQIPEQELATTKEETLTVAKKIGFPIVLKLIAEDIVHKSDTGAVKLNIKNEDETAQAYDELMNIPSQSEKSISVQKMADEPITELIIGMTTDAQFGPALMFGIGGILVELLEDVSFRIAPNHTLIIEDDAFEDSSDVASTYVSSFTVPSTSYLINASFDLVITSGIPSANIYLFNSSWTGTRSEPVTTSSQVIGSFSSNLRQYENL